MSALDSLERIASDLNLIECDFRYCLVGEDKIPYTTQGTRARPNAPEDFCSLEEIASCETLGDYAGIGISISASGICAIDVDKCFSVPFDFSSGDERAKKIVESFKDEAYIEFSFSGKGLRILFHAEDIPDYKDRYYIKNDKNKIEYYQPSGTARYVTLTGMAIYDNPISGKLLEDTLFSFLNEYMVRPKTFAKRPFTCEISKEENVSFEELMKRVRSLYMKDIEFQELWFGEAPGSGKNESQLDYHLAAILYRHVTQDRDKLMELFEASPYFKSKDRKHIAKWEYNSHRYFDYIYDHLGV